VKVGDHSGNTDTKDVVIPAKFLPSGHRWRWGVWPTMFELLNDWRAWSGLERAAVAAFALCVAVVVAAWVGV
jgi:hypothetical protein